MNLDDLNISKIRKGLLNKEFSAVELTEACLNEIKKKDRDIHAFLNLTEELALSQARKIDKKIENKEEIGALAAVPLAVKDVILVKGEKCTAGSKMLENYIAPYDATVIKKLKKAEAIILGKTNTDEFAMGSSTENSAYGPTKNPHDLKRVPGGSSGGSAAAVASGESVGALGSDTGGSVRQPGSFCGIAAFKPTYGQVSRFGLIAMASSLDQIGTMAKTANDAEKIFDAIYGADDRDSTSVRQSQEAETEEQKISGLKVGVPKEYFTAGLDKDVEGVIREAIAKYERAGAKIIEVSLPNAKYALACYYIIQPAETSANLARYDGIKYGLSAETKTLLDTYLKSRQDGLGAEVKRRIVLGTYVLSAGYYDAYYKKAQAVRALLKKDFERAFDKVDVLMGPVAPTTAFKLGEKSNDPLAMYLADIYTVSVNLAGLPAISIPCGKADNLPVGLQIIGPQFKDKKVLDVAKLYENNFA